MSYWLGAEKLVLAREMRALASACISQSEGRYVEAEMSRLKELHDRL